ncbi:MAG: sulfatase [Deltaproteobacteria bacterium]|nr:sulfatase [Deltaproteobacteria bacterium]
MASVQRLLPFLLTVLFQIPLFGSSAEPEPPGAKQLPVVPSEGASTPISSKSIDSLLLITVDTLRADALGIYGHPREPLPAVSRWADRGVTFDGAFATSSWTVPSLASLLTSLYPSSHGAIHGIRQEKVIRGQESIPEQATTLAEALRQIGFTTFGVTSNPHLASQFGFQRGFQRYMNLNRAAASKVTERVFRWREDVETAPKAFLWLHFFDPHLPFTSTPGEIVELRPELSESRVQEALIVLKELRQGLGVVTAREEPAARFLQYRAEIEALYEADIQLVNQQIEEILAAFPRFRDGVICFTADHGEEFLEHGYLGHGFNLHAETLRVPLVLVHPNLSAGQRIDRAVSLVDLAPTLLTLVGGQPQKGWYGRTVFSSRGQWKGELSPVISEVSRFELKKPQASLQQGSLKLIATGSEPRRSKNPLATPTRLELYDLKLDPGERRDISRARPLETERLYRSLLERLAKAPNLAGKRERLVLSGETLKALKALGYLQ